MREIPLTKGFVALVDDEDFDWLSRWKWSVSSTGYARRNERRRSVWMHRVLMEAPDGVLVDHINGEPLDNRRANLRLCSAAENVRNGRKRVGDHPYKGVVQSPSFRRVSWVARITVDRRCIHLGSFRTPEAAARAYDRAAKLHHGEFARLNFPEAR